MAAAVPPPRKTYTGMYSHRKAFFCLLFFHVPSAHIQGAFPLFNLFILSQKFKKKIFINPNIFINPKTDDFLRVPNLDSVWIFILNCDYGRGEIFFGVQRNWVDYFSNAFVPHTCESVHTELEWELHSRYCSLCAVLEHWWTEGLRYNVSLKPDFLYKQQFKTLNYRSESKEIGIKECWTLVLNILILNILD